MLAVTEIPGRSESFPTSSNLGLSLIPLALLVPLLRHPFYWTWLYLPVPLLALTIFTLGMTFFFATANVYYRDVTHILQVVLSAWFYVTPILYPLDFVRVCLHQLVYRGCRLSQVSGRFCLLHLSQECPQV